MLMVADPPPKESTGCPIQGTWEWLSLSATKAEKTGTTVTAPEDFDAELHIETTTIMFADVVESVRLIQQDEVANVLRIRTLLKTLATETIPQFTGTVLERRGDGLLVKFANAQGAAACALRMHAIADQSSQRREPSEVLALRIGLHTGDVLADESAIYGQGINLAARVTAIAGPGETVLSAATRDQLAAGLDGDLEDMGECYLKHVHAHVRMFRLNRSQGMAATLQPPAADNELRPTVAVLPFQSNQNDGDQQVLGEVLADGLIEEIARCPDLRVISRLSSTLFRDRRLTHERTGELCGATYIVNGRCAVSSDKVTVHTELLHSATSTLLWAERVTVNRADLLSPESEAIATISFSIVGHISTHVVRESAYRPLPNLESSALLFGAIALTHRTSLQDFNRPRLLLEQLIERHSRAAAPRVWLAHWYVLRAVQGRSEEAASDASIAISETNRALDAHPKNSLALATQGFAYCHLLKDLDRAEKNYKAALEINASDAFAWIYLAALHAFRGEGEEAEAASEQAIRCSPLDPRRHFFDAIAATAAFTNQRYEAAVSLAKRSLLGDRYHASTVRVLAMSQAMAGRVDEGRATAEELRRIEPTLTIERYLSRTPSAPYEVGTRCANALRLVGIPER